ncbi:AmmeMemoRadiSam system protein B [bacterium]|nr:AmmeMemoRadiSam system protein B [bacterium]
MSSLSEKTSFSPRKPAVAGMFYPREKNKLQSDLDNMFANVTSKRVSGKVFGIVAPHAGYMYSGYVAAEAYNQLADLSYDTVAVLAPSHRDYFQGASVYTGDYMTPLGAVPVDKKTCDQLLRYAPLIKATEMGHRDEHALEVQLPFLQVILKDFNLVPIVIGTQDHETCFRLGEILGEVLQGTNSLVVASSDLSHFYSQEKANRLDGLVVKDIENFDENKFFDDIQNRKCEACGAGTIVSAIIAAKHMGATSSKVLSYHTSGEVSGDYEEVVGYLSGVFYN